VSLERGGGGEVFLNELRDDTGTRKKAGSQKDTQVRKDPLGGKGRGDLLKKISLRKGKGKKSPKTGTDYLFWAQHERKSGNERVWGGAMLVGKKKRGRSLRERSGKKKAFVLDGGRKKKRGGLET